MRLLLVTQALDLDDPTLSVYHGWVAMLARDFESVEAVCLKKGRHQLPSNVRVHSLGKERRRVPALLYAVRFKLLSWRLRKDYDAVLVHMNQEYVLIAGLLWKFLRKPVYLWRNHYAGSLLTDIAAALCTNVFYTSTRSYTVKYRNAVRMPVGVDTERFRIDKNGERSPSSILFFSRITPSKHAELFIEALGLLKEKGIACTASVVGDASSEAYAKSLRMLARERQLEEVVAFRPGVPNEDAPGVFQAHALYVNCSSSGMLDKAIFEAAASGCIVISESEDMATFGFGDLTYHTRDAQSLAACIERVLATSHEEREGIRDRLQKLAEEHSLARLAHKLSGHLRSAGESYTTGHG